MNNIRLIEISQHTIIYNGIVLEAEYFASYGGVDTHFPYAVRYFVTSEINGFIVWYLDPRKQFGQLMNSAGEMVAEFKAFFQDRDKAIEYAHDSKRVDITLEDQKVKRAMIHA